MDYELIKNEFMKIKREELVYVDTVAKISSNKILSEAEKLEIYRTLNHYIEKLNEILYALWEYYPKPSILTDEKEKEVIIEITLDKDYLSILSFSDDYKREYVLEKLWVDPKTLKFKLTLYKLMKRRAYSGIDTYFIQNKQYLIDQPIYIFRGYYDSSEDCYGPCVGNLDDYLYGIYESLNSKYKDERRIPKKEISEFEKGKIIFYSKKYVNPFEIRDIFEEELLNPKNITLDDCVIQIKNRIEELNYTKSPEYKEKLLIDKINELYKKVKGEILKNEILYSGNFLQVIKETYRLPNKSIVAKEKILKNGGKDSVIVIAITQNKEYIITFQNRINDKVIAEFPSGYIENNEVPIEAAKRELEEETGYISDDLFLIDEAYTSLGIDNSKTYIVIANNCIKKGEENINGTEFVDYGLFSEKELAYLIYNNIMSGAINRLAYYNLINNLDDCNATYQGKRVYKKLREKRNPLEN